MKSPKHLLVLGAGSVGKRHLRNFAQLGCELSAMDPREDRLREAAKETPLRGQYTSVASAIAGAGNCDGVIICSPPKYHVDQSIAALEAGRPVFLEKPVSPDLASAERLEAAVRRTGVPLLLGYTYRWWAPLQELKRRLAANQIGRVLHVQCVMSAHLADWHPWENYSDFFMASRELGGGALLDESHFLDLMLWFFGAPERVFARVEKLSGLQIETDDNVDAFLMYASGLRVVVHLDLFGRPHEKFIRIVGEAGTLHWSFEPNQIRHSAAMEQKWTDTRFTGERNDMFVEAAKEFVRVLENGGTQPGCTIGDGVAVLRLIEAMRESTTTGASVTL